MSDTVTPPEPLPEAPLADIAPPPPLISAPETPGRRRGLWPLLGLLAFLLLAGGEAYLWKLTTSRPDLSGQVAALQTQLANLQQQFAALPPQPVAAAAAPTPAISPAVLAGSAADLSRQLAALTAQLNAMQTQIAADHGALTALQANAIDLGKLTADTAAVQTEATVDHAALLTLQSNIGDLDKQTAKISAIGQAGAARMALDAGQPLGPIADAPPALAVFATMPPPTEAGLRLSFPAAARAANAASVTGSGKHHAWATAVVRLESLVTISNGNHVIVGAPAAATLTAAGDRLDAGDLAGAVSLLNTLSQNSQQAMANWMSQARALLAARTALVSMAGQP